VPESRLYANGTDLLVFPISAVDHWKRYQFGTRHVAIPLWELPDVNPTWIAGMRTFDHVWAPSDFIADTLEQAGLDVWRAPWPHYIDHGPPLTRERFGLPSDRVIFTFAFDPSSDITRKNPQAIVDAFLSADLDGSLLCIQLNRSAEKFERLERWLETLPAERVNVINRHLSHRKAVQLIACSDVYISLHRAEGLGLGMLEAMMVGTPVIATAWSGNLSFMDDASACLVDADLIRLDGTIPAYTSAAIGKSSIWADPYLKDAVQWMQALMDPGLRQRKSEAAKAYLQGYQQRARRLDWIEQLEPQPIAVTAPSELSETAPARRKQRGE
jgi:glycosyltransferase involved in cell wall biosynthesis